jgi:arabinofuranan 3-O-arabinosyltransferase
VAGGAVTAIDQRRGQAPGGDWEYEPPALEAPRPSAGRRRVQRLEATFAARLWPSFCLFYVLAAAATLTSSGGAYVGDNRFEQYWNPARRIAKTLTVWDGSRGLGRIREDFWPATTVPLAVLRGLGFPAPAAQALFHALLISLTALGTVALVRLFRPRIGLEHVLAGLFTAFGAYSATFLLPSNLYYSFTLAPWLLVVVFRGVHSSRPWRWAAVFALLVFTAGNVDTPGLGYAMIPVAALLTYLLAVERSVRLRDVVSWLLRAGVLTVLTGLAMITKTFLAAQTLGARLGDTEAADVSAFTSSWSESLRGMGNWLSYFHEGGDLLKPQGVPYFTDGFVVACTFIPPCVALFVLWQSRWRARLLFALMIVFSALILVGGFPHNDPSPFGGRLLNAYTNIKVLSAFRNTYKVGSGLTIGVAVLFGYGVMLAYRSLRRSNPGWQLLPVLAAFVALAGVSFPFWTGQLYHPTRRTQALPAYWTEAFDYLADVPADGRSLVLPQTSRAQYRWGWVGDDIFDALDARDHAIVTGVPLSTPVPANVLEAITVVASDPDYQPGTLAPLMRRLGLTEIVLRNDLEWQDLKRPRPSAFDALRADPDLTPLRTFGRVGENTARPDDRTDLADRDRRYPPVEVFGLKNPVGTVTTTPAGAPLLLAGDGFGWAPLAQAHLLDGSEPVAFTADRDAAGLTDDLERGSPLVVTDSNRRRLRVVLAFEADYSHTLAEGQELDRPTQSLWRTDGSQSVAWFPDATVISATGAPRSASGSLNWNRPSAAFDGDPTTGWAVRASEEPVGRSLGVQLRQPTEVREAHVSLLAGAKPGITRAHLRFSDGSVVPVQFLGREAAATFPPRRTTSVELVIDEVVPDVELVVGVAEMTVPGVDLTEHIQVPDDVFRKAETDTRLAAALRGAPTGWVFSRSVQSTSQTNPLPAKVGAATTDEETAIRRRFRTLGARDVDVGGRLRLRPDTPEDVIDRLIGGDHGAAASERQNGALEGIGARAVDGDPTTGWLAPAQSGVSITLRFPRQEVRFVDVGSRYDDVSSHVDRVQVETADPGNPLGVLVTPATNAAEPVSGPNGEVKPTDPACDTSPKPKPDCVRTGRVTLAKPIVTDHLTVRVTGVSGRAAELGGRIRVDEITVNGQGNKPLYTADARPAPCLALGVRLDGPGGLAGTDTLGLTVDAPLDDLLKGRGAAVKGCAPVRLGEGWHTLDTGSHAPFDELQLLEPALAARVMAPAPAAPRVTVVDRAPTEWSLRLPDNRRGTVLVFNQSYDGGWRAVANGVPLGRPRDLNGMNAWVVDQDGPVEIELVYNPRSLFGYSLPVTGLAIALCAYLALRRPRSERIAAGQLKTGGPRG